LKADVNSTKLRLIENDIKRKTEESTRAAILNGKRIRTKNKSLRFIGEPRIYKEILDMTELIEQDPSRDDLIVMLEDMSVYGNSSPYSLERLSELVCKIANSLIQILDFGKDTQVKLRVYALLDLVTSWSKNPKYSEIFFKINFNKSFQDSDQTLRIQAL
jgi:hypothetical protein